MKNVLKKPSRTQNGKQTVGLMKIWFNLFTHLKIQKGTQDHWFAGYKKGYARSTLSAWF
jgi:hypothetical protein